MSKDLVRFFKLLRVLNGERQADVAKRLGVTPRVISMMETGRRPLAAQRLAQLLDDLAPRKSRTPFDREDQP